MNARRRQLTFKLTNYQLKIIVESLRELGVNVIFTFTITLIFETRPTVIQFLVSVLIAGLSWYTGFIISQKINHE